MESVNCLMPGIGNLFLALRQPASEDSEERSDVEDKIMNAQAQVDSLWPRRVQLAVAAPSLLLWTFLSSLAIFWYSSLAISAMSGTLATGDWRFSYLIVTLLIVLACSSVTARTLWLAYRGRSCLWWHACSFGVGIVLRGLIGIVGD
jgi:hypothetical protein